GVAVGVRSGLVEYFNAFAVEGQRLASFIEGFVWPCLGRQWRLHFPHPIEDTLVRHDEGGIVWPRRSSGPNRQGAEAQPGFRERAIAADEICIGAGIDDVAD